MPSTDQFDTDSTGNHNRRLSDQWHVGKEIPLALIAVVLIQTAGGVWWASSMTSKIDSAIVQLAEFKTERYTKDDGRRDREFLQLIVDSLKSKDIELDRRMAVVERQHEGAPVIGGIKR